MAIVRITEVPNNRREITTEVEIEVRGFRGATAVIAKDLRQSASDGFRNRVMRLWAKNGKAGGFAVRNSHYAHVDSWVLFEYVECGGFSEEMPHDTAVRKSLHSSGFHQYCNKKGSNGN
jgi:hypothetical protein